MWYCAKAGTLYVLLRMRLDSLHRGGLGVFLGKKTDHNFCRDPLTLFKIYAKAKKLSPPIPILILILILILLPLPLDPEGH